VELVVVLRSINPEPTMRCIDGKPFKGNSMKKLLALTLAIVFVGGSAVHSADEKDIVATAVGAKSFETLVTAVKAAGLVETLQSKGPFTVFAPTDEAFKKVPKDKLEALLKDKEALKKVLLAHVITEKSVMAADVVKLNGEKVNGFTIKVADGKVSLSNKNGTSNVVKTDIKCTNGVIHVIDTVMLPE
jgi:uncharacterized surface protein with fasciclin (FAS1) repeats